eukprot:TRINITY_DN9237_c0_g1_i1.p1 TRINITY_DN9237_c0_g1~~TRINITY_DN9237_c0_g1_i1.p1  ORF type:complete len:464 (+),score=67.32 TRINITY_DN9237_c0_g1_i1:25-1416(+)
MGRHSSLAILLSITLDTCTEAGHAKVQELINLQRCASSGHLLDLTNSTAGASPRCVSTCPPSSVRSVQAGGFAFCLHPIIRSDALDVSFSLALRNVSWQEVPPAHDFRVRMPLVIGQALQVPPGDVMGEVMMRDVDAYVGSTLVNFELRRKNEPVNMQDRFEQLVRQAESNHKDANRAAFASSVNGSTAPRTAPREDPLSLPDFLIREKRRSSFRKARMSRFMPCYRCNVYLAVRCESWRIGSPGTLKLDTPLLRALEERRARSVIEELGLSGSWEVLHFSTALRSHDLPALEVVGTESAFRFDGYAWGFDPLIGNTSRDWAGFPVQDPLRDLRFQREDTDRSDNLKFDFSGMDDPVYNPEGSTEIMLVGAVLLAVLFLAAGTHKLQRGGTFSSMGMGMGMRQSSRLPLGLASDRVSGRRSLGLSSERSEQQQQLQLRILSGLLRGRLAEQREARPPRHALNL